MIKIGITGSISSGKSTVINLIKKRKYPLFDADEVVKKLYFKENVKRKIRNIFKIDVRKNLKQELKKLIIKNKRNIIVLEKIIHPAVRREMNLFLKKSFKGKIKILEIPLLIESKLAKHFDVIIFVGAPRKLRLKRYLIKGGKKEIFTTLDQRQLNEDKKKGYCDHIIVNNKTLNVLKSKISKIMKLYE